MSIKNNLNSVIRSINDFSSRTNMVALNTAIRASKLNKSEGAPFEVLAREIQNMSVQSIDKLKELDNLVTEIAELSVLINKTGGQRMLLMKMVNASWSNNKSLSDSSINIFNNHFVEIKHSKINNASAHSKINEIEQAWLEFQSKIGSSTPGELFEDALLLIDKINQLIHEYERHAG